MFNPFVSHFMKNSISGQWRQVCYIPYVSFSSCQRNLIKTFQIEGMITLITKITLIFSSHSKIQQTKMLVTCQRFGDLFLFGLVWQYSSIQKNIVKVGSKSRILTCSCHITLSLPFYTDPASKRELNFSNGYLSLLYFCLWVSVVRGLPVDQPQTCKSKHYSY